MLDALVAVFAVVVVIVVAAVVVLVLTAVVMAVVGQAFPTSWTMFKTSSFCKSVGQKASLKIGRTAANPILKATAATASYFVQVLVMWAHRSRRSRRIDVPAE